MKGLEIQINGTYINPKIVNTIVKGGENQFECSFTFSEDWQGLNKIAVFECDDIVKDMVIDNDVCRIPDEILVSDNFLISVLGVLNEETIYSTAQARIPVYEGSDGGEDIVPTPDVFQQYIIIIDGKLTESKQILEETKAVKDEILSEANTIITNGIETIENISENAIIEVGQIRDDTQAIKDSILQDTEDIKSEIVKVKDDGVAEINKAVSDNIATLNTIKEQTEDIKNQTEDIGNSAVNNINKAVENGVEELNTIKEETSDIRDIALSYTQAITYPVFDIDTDTGELVIESAEKLENTGFSLNRETGDLEVIVTNG